MGLGPHKNSDVYPISCPDFWMHLESILILTPRLSTCQTRPFYKQKRGGQLHRVTFSLFLLETDLVIWEDGVRRGTG